MNIQSKFIIILTVLAGFMLLSVGYLAPMQNWLAFNSYVSKNQLNQSISGFSEVSGIRHIVSIQPSAATVEKSAEVEIYDSQPETVKKTTLQSAFTAPQSYSVNSWPVQSEAQTSENTSVKQLRKLPLIVELENELLIEFTSDYSEREMQTAISRLMVMPELNAQQMLAKNSLNLKKRPYFYQRILNQYGKAVRYPAQSYHYANYALQNYAQSVHDEQGSFIVVSIPLINYELPMKVKPYQHLVEKYAQQHSIDSELVYAVMEVESSFNPKAVSKSNALGLMQIKASSAGRDVYKYIDDKPGQPSKRDLFNPAENIRIGTAYLGLLKHMYFAEVKDERKRNVLSIASYNGGMSTVFKLFGKTQDQAIKMINRMSLDRIYRILLNRHESAETRRYVKKVSDKREKYQKILQLAA